jgi:hypothetical protein
MTEQKHPEPPGETTPLPEPPSGEETPDQKVQREKREREAREAREKLDPEARKRPQ